MQKREVLAAHWLSLATEFAGLRGEVEVEVGRVEVEVARRIPRLGAVGVYAVLDPDLGG